jgi:hypothetical protein
MKKTLITTIIILLALTTTNIRAYELINSSKMSSKEVSFIQNKSQWDTSELGNGNLELEEEEILFLAEMPGVNVWVCDDGIRFEYYEFEEIKQKDKRKEMLHHPVLDYENEVSYKKKSHVIRMDFVGCNENLQSNGLKKKDSYYNYFIGNDTSRWASKVPLFEEVIIENLYDGIDLRLYFDDIKPDGIEKHQISYGKHLRYDFIINPGADPSQIKFSFDGQNGLDINDNGEINLSTILGDVRHGDIFAYQNNKMSGIEGTSEQKQEVTCTFKQKGNTISFNTGEYDKTKELVIDPLIYSTFVGGTTIFTIMKTDYKEGDGIYCATETAQHEYPVTKGAFSYKIQGMTDIAVSKFKDKTFELEYSTFIGGTSHEDPDDIKVDSQGNVCILASLFSGDFPTTENCYQNYKSSEGSADIGIIKLSKDGSNLLYSSYFGGTDLDIGNCLYPISNAEFIFSGLTRSSDYPIKNAYDNSYHEGLYDNVITKFNIETNEVIFSTYLIGSEREGICNIAFNSKGEMIIYGTTFSKNFPVTDNAMYKEFNGGTYDSFIAKLDIEKSELVYSTYFGGSGADGIWDLTFDDEDNLYIVGSTSSEDFPTTENAYSPNINKYTDGFVCKISNDLTRIIYSTLIGGRDIDSGGYIIIDENKNILVSGYTRSSNFPITENAFKKNKGGDTEIVIFQMDEKLENLRYSTFFGASFDDYIRSMHINSSYDIILSGVTKSWDFPTTDDALDNSFNSVNDRYDNFITVMNIEELYTSVENDSYNDNINSMVHPNPAYDLITINLDNKISFKDAEIKISNIYGENILELHNQDLSNPITIDIRNLPVGTYFLRIIAGNEGISEKVLKK